MDVPQQFEESVDIDVLVIRAVLLEQLVDFVRVEQLAQIEVLYHVHEALDRQYTLLLSKLIECWLGSLGLQSVVVVQLLQPMHIYPPVSWVLSQRFGVSLSALANFNALDVFHDFLSHQLRPLLLIEQP